MFYFKFIKSSAFSKTNEVFQVNGFILNETAICLFLAMLCEKIKIFFLQFPHEVKHFIANDGQLNYQKDHYGIFQISVCEEKLSADEDIIETYYTDLRAFILKKKNYLDQIFNANKTRLNYKMFPRETLIVRTKMLILGAKKSKKRLTTMMCATLSSVFISPYQ